jgi:hypothetical protein
MTHHEFHHFLGSLDALSPDQIRELHRALEARMAATVQETPPVQLTDAEADSRQIQRRLFDAGLLGEIKPPIRDLTPYRDRKPVPIQGEPLSETVLHERR